MKKNLFSMLAVLVLLLGACNSKSGKDTDSSENNYFQDEVGREADGVLSITNIEVIKKDWESRLSKEKSISLRDFRIVKAYTLDEKRVEYYMLVATSADGKLKTASLLNLKNNSFYFDTNEDQDGSSFFSNITCEGNCSEGCLPVVTIYNGVKYLNCSPCADCVKKESEIR